MDDWLIVQHQSAAIEMCFRLGLNPNEPQDMMAINSPPMWHYYARKMAEHELMVQVMRQFGRPV